MSNALTTKDLIIFLVTHGYQYYKPACKTWQFAFIHKQGQNLLCVLLRKNGIDLRLYENYRGGVSIDSEKRISMRGGLIYRNHYNESKNHINQKIKVVTSCFTKGTINEALRTEDGRSYLLNPNYEQIRKSSRTAYQKMRSEIREKQEWADILDYVREDLGGYWGDGQWMDR